MKHFTRANSYSPPPLDKHGSGDLLCRWLLVMLLAFVPGIANAAFNFYDNAHGIDHQPTIDQPHIQIGLCIYDTNGHDAFFMHDGAEPGHAGPAIYIDGKWLCSADWELAWPGEGTGNDGGLNDEKGKDGWCWNTYTNTIDGVKYTVKWFNPRKFNGRFYVTLHIFPEYYKVEESHTIKIRGLWRINAEKTEWQEKEFKINPLPNPFKESTLKATFTNYNTAELTGDLNTRFGYDTHVAVAKEYPGPEGAKRFIDETKFTGWKNFTKGTAAISNMPFNVSDYYAEHDRKFYVQHYLSVPPAQSGYVHTYVWSGSEVTLADPLWPVNIKAAPDMWKKQVTLTWDIPENSNDLNRLTNGSWTIYRSPASAPDELLPIVSGLPNTTRKYVADVPEYDRDYIYTVEFRPKDIPDGERILRLSDKVTCGVYHEYNLSDFNVEGAESSINLSWDAPQLKGNENYVFKIFRTEFGDPQTNKYTDWEEIGSVAVTDKNQVTYTYTDRKNLETCPVYYYKVKITMLENYTFELPDNLVKGGSLTGQTKVTSVSATKGESGQVKISWDVDQIGADATKFEVLRSVKGKDKWVNIYKTSGTASSYFYEDNSALPGQYYDYKVVWITSCGSSDKRQEAGDDGFCRALGTVSGRIAYGTGTAVADARVTLVRTGDDENGVSQFYSMRTKNIGDGVFLDLDSDRLTENFANSAYSVQMLVRPNETQEADYPTLFDLSGKLQVQLGKYESGKGFPVIIRKEGETESASTDIYLPANAFTSLTFAVDASGIPTLTCISAEDELKENTLTGSYKVSFTAPDAKGLCLGGDYAKTAGGVFNGYIDEMRIFSGVALTKEQILKNYNHSLVGTEEGLFAYWPVDEGIDQQTTAYDYSKTGGVANGNHARLGPSTSPSNEVIPTEHQFSLFGYTDAQGNFTIRGVPFTGEGTTYMVVPMLGSHEFSPTYATRYVGPSALIHNSVDFEDVSSFAVKGRIFYAGTNYPVEGVQFAVDGNVCSKDGEIITTNAAGEFTISVPIGDHFIKASMNGHDFANDGRYPADPNNTGERLTFDRNINGLEFNDVTLVNFTGKVVGGDIEGDKAVGFGLSKNNIGVAELILKPTDTRYNLNVVRQTEGTTVNYVTNDQEVAVESATGDIASEAKRGAGGAARQIIIRTDPKSGEFSAKVPPLMYSLEAPVIVAKDKDATVGSATTIDLTNPLVEASDTLYNEAGEVTKLYEYNLKHVVAYHSAPVFTVNQTGNPDGVYGIQEYTTTDELGEEFTVSDIYTQDADGKPVYNYGAPIFEMMYPYTFKMKAFEEYVNEDDKANPVVDRVPLRGLEVTVSNALSTEQAVYALNNPQGGTPGTVVDMVDNTLVLDSEGEATYMWKAGLPNITAPFKRTISIAYDINDRTYMWDPAGDGTNMQEGIILGYLPTGNNFVTEGPSVLQMILRDPPGTASSASWTSGQVSSRYTYKGSKVSTENNLSTTLHLGLDLTVAYGIGAMTIQTFDMDLDQETGINITNVSETGNSHTTTLSTERTISTSAEPEYVGANGDLFIGTSNNLIFGENRNVNFQRDNGGNISLGVKDDYSTGLKFKTSFAYSAFYIENVLIPNLIELRNSKLIHVNNVDSYSPSGDEVVYLTTLTPEAEGYGTNNNDRIWGKDLPLSSEGQSYTMKVGDAAKSYSDEIVWYNSQIESWKSWLAVNEQEKVRAYDERSSDTQNYSFESGSTVTYTATNEKGKGQHYDTEFMSIAHIGTGTGISNVGIGVSASVSTDTGGGTHSSGESAETDIASFSYTLAETGDDDAITVDVYNYGKYAPIFRTRGGQTSGPYEGEVKTKYYRPGTTIMDATMQIEVPKIAVDVATVTNVPAGQAANYTLRMTNESQTNEDVYYTLMMMDETNPNGAKLTIDGSVLTDGRVIKIPAGEMVTKALQLTQTNPGILDYENIGIVLASQTQYDPTSTWEQIADTVYVSAHFAPSSSTVGMKLSRTTLNSTVGDKLTISFNNFDRKYVNLKAFRIQYKRPGDTDWNLLHEYTVGGTETTATSEPLPADGTTVDYDLDMHSFSDGQYMFRVVSVATYGNDEVYNSSEEMTVVKDMQRPAALGTPSPANGILTAADDISLTFNENILSSELLQTKNFLITGVLNGAKVDHSIALNLGGMEDAAATEAAINLSDKSFAFDLWLNAKAAGTILSHGAGASRFSAAIDADNHLVVSIGTEQYTSTGEVPMDKWAFLHMSYGRGADAGRLNAAVASDDKTVTLFNDNAVAQNAGNGPLAVGRNMNAAIHELTLWDEARSVEVSLMERSATKRPSTRHLIGYWKMNEGEGTSIRDYSRSRNMTATAESWSFNNENKAIDLDGSNRLVISMAECSPLDTDDYAVELWMRGDSQEKETQLIQSGETGLWMTQGGLLRLTSGENTFEAGTAPLTDNAWHHVALNVLRNGNAAVYVDGNRTLAVSAAKVGGIASDSLYVGARRGPVVEGEHTFDRYFKGQVDELRVWNATLNAEFLSKGRRMRLTGTEPGLAAYYPFEEKSLDSYNQVVTNGSDLDLVSGKHAVLSKRNTAYTDEAPAMAVKPQEENIDFSFVANDNSIVISLKEEEAILDGTTVNITVREVRDENGNISSPVRWTAYVNRRQLEWSDDNVVLTQQGGTQSTFTVDVVNTGGKEQMWQLSGLPAWLTADVETGTTAPLDRTEVAFTVAPSTPVGNYSQTIYLTGNDEIDIPLTLNIKVTGVVPDWTVEPGDYEFTMNMIARLSILGVPSADADDKVAVFIGDECRGVARPVYNKRYDSYFLLLDIYGNNEDGNAELSFRAYDASTGVSYPKLACSKGTMTFVKNTIAGSYAEPVLLNALDIIEQGTALNKGWTWMSLFVTPDDNSMPSVLAPVREKVTVAKSQTSFMVPAASGWNGEAIAMNNREMYKVNLTAAASLSTLGKVVTPTDRAITLSEGWNWIAYNNAFTISIDEAFAGMQPQTGDLVKGQSGFAIYDGYEWSGSLALLEPAKGYMLYSSAAAERSFAYPTAASHSKIAKVKGMGLPPAGYFTPVDYHRYPDNMSLIARVTLDGNELADAEIGVYADDECRSHAFTDGEGMAYVTIPGDNPVSLTFKLVREEKLYTAARPLDYSSDDIVGTVDAPYEIEFFSTSGVSLIGADGEGDCEWYDLNGIRFTQKPTVSGFYIKRYYNPATGSIVAEKVFIDDNDVIENDSERSDK